MPRSVLLGRPWPAAGEPLFLADDLDGALALDDEERGTCDGCGQPKDESMAPESEGQYRARLVACHACAEIQATEIDLREGTAERGVRIAVERTG